MKKIYTIQDLADGKCAVKNDGTLGELEVVLRKAFPFCPMRIYGRFIYYMADSLEGNNCWKYHDNEYTGEWQSVKEFVKQLDNNKMRKISYTQAQSIIDAACITWKNKLFSVWGLAIVFKNPTIAVSDEFYKEMRAHCTPEQHSLFDTIFGKERDFSILNDNDVFFIKTKGDFSYLFKGGNPFTESVNIACLATNKSVCAVLCEPEDVVELRKATEEEIAIYNKHYNICPYEKDELILVYDIFSCHWIPLYSTGELTKEGKAVVYAFQKKSSNCASSVSYTSHRKAFVDGQFVMPQTP